MSNVINKERRAAMPKDEDKPELDISECDSNAFVLLGRASRVAKDNNMDWDAIRAEATAGDYEHLLATLFKYFDVI